ncbi:unnamed protein product [Mycena citricolor]|uniref:Sulfotransferase family protein n=1 Tax=Mycena citricolor TaxID=2018698 RepID=A0AAD2HGS5_9AGAR|nr:unnamed protein product [Mycena citricolor]
MAAPQQQHAGTVKILGFGLSRTGTSSMKVALHMLGYEPTNHGFDLFDDPEVMDQWIRALEAKYYGIGQPLDADDWRRFLARFQGVTDIPHYLFVEELLAAFPDAKVPVTYRDPKAWWKSFASTILKLCEPITTSEHAAPNESQHVRRVRLSNMCFAVLFKIRPEDMGRESITEEVATAAFEAHYEYLRAVVPKERLLIFSVKEGWAPLCTFLGKDIPDTPFPRVNDSEQFDAVFPDILKNGRDA